MELLEWDAAAYAGLPLPHESWGTKVLDQLRLRGDEVVIDFGAGTGRDTCRLLDRLPNGRVIAVDGSAKMLAELSSRATSARGNRLRIVEADLREPLKLNEHADAAMSVATLHWLPDHDIAFRNVARSLRSGGRFVAEAGGAGNIDNFRQALATAGADSGERFWNFAGVDETKKRLASAGFVDVNVTLQPDPTRLERGEQLESYIATVMLGAHLRELPAEQRRPLVERVAARLRDPVIDYVRLQISATRA